MNLEVTIVGKFAFYPPFFSLPKERSKEKARQNDASALSETLPKLFASLFYF
jgi:hypothetical protein